VLDTCDTEAYEGSAQRHIGGVYAQIRAKCGATNFINKWNRRHLWEQLPCNAFSCLYMSSWCDWLQNPIYAGCLFAKLELIRHVFGHAFEGEHKLHNEKFKKHRSQGRCVQLPLTIAVYIIELLVGLSWATHRPPLKMSGCSQEPTQELRTFSWSLTLCGGATSKLPCCSTRLLNFCSLCPVYLLLSTRSSHGR